MEDNITLIVKAANQSVSDYHVQCSMDWTVLKLKQNLALSFPSKPCVEEQRLIYSGKLMSDHLDLRAVLRHPSDNNSYIIHLVCSPLRPNKKTTSAATIPTTTMTRAGENTDYTDGLRHRNTTTNSETVTPQQDLGGTSTSYSMPQFLPNINPVTTDPVQQMAAMHQMYTQYMASYMNYMQTSGFENLIPPASSFQFPTTAPAPVVTSSPSLPSDPSSVSSSTSDSTEDEQQHATDERPQPAQPQPQAQQQQPIRMNAQGGEVDDNDEEERDWLDYASLAFRLFGFLCMVYFYSTLSRFMLVISTGLMIYFYQAGWFRPTRREPLPPPNEQPQVVPPTENNNERDDDRNNNIQNNNNNNDVPPEVIDQQDDVPQVDESVNSTDDNTARPQTNSEEGDTQPRPSLYALSWTFLTTFFTSLFPEQQQII